jgi:cytidyltransferase-like protein
MLIKTIPWGLLGWYDWDRDRKILYIGREDDLYAGFFADGGYDNDILEISELTEQWASEHTGLYGYIVSIAYLECTAEPVEKLRIMKQVLKADGNLLLGMNNRLGLRYFCGDRDPHTGRYFDGIDGYTQVTAAVDTAVPNADMDKDKVSGRAGHAGCCSRAEIKRMLISSGWTRTGFYSVLPGLKDASLLFAEDYLPKEDLSSRVFPSYNDPDSIFLNEQGLYPALVEEGLFHGMANAYLIECSADGVLQDALQVTSSMGRGREDAMYTIIRGNGTVEKKAVYPEGTASLKSMHEHDEELKKRGLKVVDSRVEDNRYVMPRIEYETAQTYLKKLMRTDMEKFLEEMDRFRDTVLASSEIKTLEDGIEVFEKGYFDLVPLNCFYVDGEFVFFDQEFCVEELPVKVMALRQIASFYFGDPGAEKLLPVSALQERYGLTEELSRWQSIEWGFLNKLLNNSELRDYHRSSRTDIGRIKKRRDAIERRYLNIFSGIEGKRLYLFGSGKYADRFLDMYGDDFPVYGILDNDESRQGTKKREIMIYSPEVLKDMKPGTFKVMICMREYSAVAKQLDDLGVIDYSVYDPNRYYETRPRTSIRIVEKTPGDSRETEAAANTAVPANTGNADDGATGNGAICDSVSSAIGNSTTDSGDKHYHIGYCAGAFDMFHIGHLNLLRRAKERCDHLIVGVMSDERMYNLKKKYPVIPCNERMQVVAGCRYVDRVEELPADRAGIMDAYNMFHYDCMFSGDDHVNDPGWLAERERLRAVGSDIVFVSYTKETSSSAITEKMKEG